MKRLILLKILQDPKFAKEIFKKLYGTLEQIPVKKIIHMIIPALEKLMTMFEQWIVKLLEFAMKKAEKFSALA